MSLKALLHNTIMPSDLGADLSIISSEDNTIMHSIVKNTVLDPSKIDAFIKVNVVDIL